MIENSLFNIPGIPTLNFKEKPQLEKLCKPFPERKHASKRFQQTDKKIEKLS